MINTVEKRLVIAHTCNDYDDDKNPKNHIKVEVCASAVASAVTHVIASFLMRFFNTAVIYTMFFYKIWKLVLKFFLIWCIMLF